MHYFRVPWRENGNSLPVLLCAVSTQGIISSTGEVPVMGALVGQGRTLQAKQLAEQMAGGMTA